MNCLLFSECMSIKCRKNKARFSPQRIRTTKNHWSLKNLIFKANIWHPGLENARDHVKSNLLRSCSAGRGVAKLRCYEGVLLKSPSKIAFSYNNTVSTNEIYADIHVINVFLVYFYALFWILSSTRAFGTFLLVETSITGPSSCDLLVIANEEHSIWQC